MTTKEKGKEERKQIIRNSLNDVVAGAAAGAFAKTATAPIERVKLLMQLRGSLEAKSLFGPKEGGRGGGNVTASSSSSAWHVAKSIYYEEGIIAFWRGKIIVFVN